MLPIEIKLSKKSYTFWAIFLMHFWLLHEIFNVLKKRMNLIGKVFLKFLTPTNELI